MLTYIDHHLFQQDMVRTKHTLHAVEPSHLPFLHFPFHQQHLIAALLTTRFSVCTSCVYVVMPSTLIQHKILIQNCILSRHAHTLKNRSHGHAQVIFALTALYHWKQPFQFAEGVQESLVSWRWEVYQDDHSSQRLASSQNMTQMQLELHYLDTYASDLM